MEFIVEKSLKDFDFWGGATWFANQLTDDQFDLIESYLESAKCEGEYYTDGEINDIFWHDPESLYPALPIEELCRIILYKDDNAEYNDLVDDFIDNYYRLDRLDYTESDIKEAWSEWLEEETLDKAKEIINSNINNLLMDDVITQDQIDDEAIEEWVDDWLFESKLDISDGEDLFKSALLKAWEENRNEVLGIDTSKEEIKAYVENNVHRFAERYDLALEKIGEMRCPLSMADDSLFNDIRNAVDDWCSDNDKDPDDYDIEEMFG